MRIFVIDGVPLRYTVWACICQPLLCDGKGFEEVRTASSVESTHRSHRQYLGTIVIGRRKPEIQEQKDGRFTRRRNAAGELWCRGCKDYHAAEAFSRQGPVLHVLCRESRNAVLKAKREALRQPRSLVCEVCTKQFTTNNRRQQYCSFGCRRKAGEARRERLWTPITRICRRCGTSFQAMKPWAVRCSRACKEAEQNAKRRKGGKQPAPVVTFSCKHCGTEVKKLQRWFTRKKPQFCSSACWYGYQKDGNSPLDRGIRYTTRGRDWPKIVEVIRSRDENRCVICGRVEKRKPHVDHIVPYRLMLRWSELDPNDSVNLASLCSSCHGRKTPCERLLLDGDVVGYLTQLRWMSYPPGMVKSAFVYAGLPYIDPVAENLMMSDKQFNKLLGIE